MNTTAKNTSKTSVSTTKITNVLKISEFPDLADAYADALNNNNDRRWVITDLLQKQTQAKQDKFFNFFYANYKNCENPKCGKFTAHKVRIWESQGDFCSFTCAYEAKGL